MSVVDSLSSGFKLASRWAIPLAAVVLLIVGAVAMRESKPNADRPLAGETEPAASVESGREAMAPRVPNPLVIADAPPADVADGSELDAGDRVELTVNEPIDAASGNAGQTGAVIRRNDLSQEYEIGSSGRMRLPTLGSLEVAGRSVDEAERLIRDAYRRTFGRPALVSMRIVERQPVYVNGFVTQPGVYKFIPDMTVAHAVSLASGLARPVNVERSEDASLRELFQYKQAVIRLEQLLREYGRLIAERDDEPLVAVPAELTQLLGVDKANAVIRRENRLLVQMREMRRLKAASLERSIALYERQVEALQGQSASVGKQQTSLGKLRKRMSDVRRGGYIREEEVLKADLQVLDMESKKSALIAALAEAEQQLAESRNQLADLKLAHAVEVEKRLAEVEIELAELRMNVNTSKMALDQLRGLDGSGFGSILQDGVTYQIQRQQQQRAVVMDADETTRLRPGDVLRVGLKKKPNGPGDAGAPAPAIDPLAATGSLQIQ